MTRRLGSVSGEHGRAGGLARASRLSPARRREIAALGGAASRERRLREAFARTGRPYPYHDPVEINARVAGIRAALAANALEQTRLHEALACAHAALVPMVD